MRGPEPCGETRDGRRRMRKYGWLILASLLWVGNAFAQTDYDGRWYVSPSVGAVFSDKNDLDSGFAGSLAVGRSIAPNLGLELEGGYSYLDVKDLTKQNDYKRTFLGLNLLGYLVPSDWTVRPYLLGNVNGHSLKFLRRSEEH